MDVAILTGVYDCFAQKTPAIGLQSFMVGESLRPSIYEAGTELEVGSGTWPVLSAM
jgi:hypothetical protein